MDASTYPTADELTDLCSDPTCRAQIVEAWTEDFPTGVGNGDVASEELFGCENGHINTDCFTVAQQLRAIARRNAA